MVGPATGLTQMMTDYGADKLWDKALTAGSKLSTTITSYQNEINAGTDISSDESLSTTVSLPTNVITYSNVTNYPNLKTPVVGVIGDVNGHNSVFSGAIDVTNSINMNNLSDNSKITGAWDSSDKSSGTFTNSNLSNMHMETSSGEVYSLLTDTIPGSVIAGSGTTGGGNTLGETTGTVQLMNSYNSKITSVIFLSGGNNDPNASAYLTSNFDGNFNGVNPGDVAIIRNVPNAATGIRIMYEDPSDPTGRARLDYDLAFTIKAGEVTTIGDSVNGLLAISPGSNTAVSSVPDGGWASSNFVSLNGLSSQITSAITVSSTSDGTTGGGSVCKQIYKEQYENIIEKAVYSSGSGVLCGMIDICTHMCCHVASATCR